MGRRGPFGGGVCFLTSFCLTALRTIFSAVLKSFGERGWQVSKCPGDSQQRDEHSQDDARGW